MDYFFRYLGIFGIIVGVVLVFATITLAVLAPFNHDSNANMLWDGTKITEVELEALSDALSDGYSVNDDMELTAPETTGDQMADAAFATALSAIALGVLGAVSIAASEEL